MSGSGHIREGHYQLGVVYPDTGHLTSEKNLSIYHKIKNRQKVVENKRN